MQEYQHDSYKMSGKLKEPTACKACGPSFQRSLDVGLKAGRRERDRLPGLLAHQDNYRRVRHIEGAYKDQHRDQVMGSFTIRRPRKERTPLARIMTIRDQPEGLVISTTDSHLPRRIGEALKHSHHGALDVQYDKDEEFVRVTWTS